MKALNGLRITKMALPSNWVTVSVKLMFSFVALLDFFIAHWLLSALKSGKSWFSFSRVHLQSWGMITP